MTRRVYFLVAVFGIVFCLGPAGGVLAGSSSPGGGPASPEQSSTAPVIEVPEPNFDFGEAIEGEVIAHQYVVKNTGTGTLQIGQVRPG